jgi:hypothetical protein
MVDHLSQDLMADDQAVRVVGRPAEVPGTDAAVRAADAELERADESLAGSRAGDRDLLDDKRTCFTRPCD